MGALGSPLRSRSRGPLALVLVGLVLDACRSEEPPQAPPPAVEEVRPRIVRFDVSRASVGAGESVSLAWVAEDAVAVELVADPGGALLEDPAPMSGTVSSRPLSVDTSFTLSAVGSSGVTATSSQRVAVVTDPEDVAIVRFTASPATIEPGRGSTLSYEVVRATEVLIIASGGEPVLEARGDPAGSVVVTPLVDTTYTLTARGPGGPKLHTVTVSVEVASMPPGRGACGDLPRGPAAGLFVLEPDALPTPVIPVEDSFRGSGGGVADLDRDGRPDLVLASRGAPLVVLRNAGGLRFEEVPGRGGIPAASEAAGVALGDLDNDGDPELVLLGTRGTSLFENRGGATFAPIPSPDLASKPVAESSTLTDLDGDGRLELLLNMFGPLRAGRERRRDALFENTGGLQLVDAGGRWGLFELAGTHASATFDADRDGDLDLYFATDAFILGSDAVPQRDLLVENLGRGEDGELRLEDRTAAFGLAEPHASMGAVVGDLDDDGLLDLYVSNFGLNPAYIALPGGGYADRTSELGVFAGYRRIGDCAEVRSDPDCALVSWGAVLEDFDNDGFAELIVTNGHVEVRPAARPVIMLVRSPGGGLVRYEERDPGLGCLDGRALLPADFDGDGDLDLVVIGRSAPVAVYRTEAPPENRWLRVLLQGTTSNRDGVGAVVALELESGRRLVRAVGAGGMIYSSLLPMAHFGLGRELPAAIEVRWPSGQVQHISPVEPDQELVLVEP